MDAGWLERGPALKNSSLNGTFTIRFEQFWNQTGVEIEASAEVNDSAEVRPIMEPIVEEVRPILDEHLGEPWWEAYYGGTDCYMRGWAPTEPIET